VTEDDAAVSGDRAGTDNRVRLLQAAADAFAATGFDGTSLRNIADSAGVAFQLIAYYFGNKEDLWRATIDYLFELYLESGKALTFTVSSNVREQFRNHLRFLLTDMLQRPQLRKIYVQEQLASSSRYKELIEPRIRYLYDTLAMPYFGQVVSLGIVSRYSPEEIAILWSSIVQINVVFPAHVELLFNAPVGTPKSIEVQVDLAFRILTEGANEHGHGLAIARDRQTELLVENRKLQEIVDNLTLEKRSLSETLQRLGEDRQMT
jgi:TetR/AcrR family transcriptional regulator